MNSERKTAYNAAYRARTRDQAIDRSRRWAKANPIRYLMQAARARARKKGIEFSITENDLLPIPEFCPVFGTRLSPCRSGNGSAYSLDRINNSIGYVPGNVRIISRAANVLKADGTVEQFKALIRYMEGQ